MRRLLFITLAILLTGLLQKAKPALACSGGPPPTTLEYVLENAQYYVKAEVVASDLGDKNLRLRAMNYLIGGSGPRELVLQRENPVLTAVYDVHHYDTGCLYGGAEGIPVGLVAYFAIQRQPNGAYRPVYDQISYGASLVGDGLFTEVPVRIDPSLPDSDENLEWRSFAGEEEFVAVIEERSGETPAEPTPNDLPRLTPLLVTTASGTPYIIPIDNGDPIQVNIAPPPAHFSATAYPDVLNSPLHCTRENPACRVSRPDGSLQASFKADTPATIAVNYYPYDTPPIEISGQAFMWSSTGEVLAVVDDGELALYLVNNAVCDCVYGEFVPALDPIFSTPVGENFAIAGIRWSADGTTMAYADARGVWLLDIFRMRAPELVSEAIEGVEQLKPLFLSTTGRFLAYATSPIATAAPIENWLTLDRISGLTYENAIFSPNERYMVQIAPENPTERPDVAGCKLPIAEDCQTIFWEAPQRFEWINDDQFYAVTCQANGLCELKGVLADYLTFHTGADSAALPDTAGKIHAVAYEPEQNLYAVAMASYYVLLMTDPSDSRYLDSSILDLRDVLDSEVVAVAWLPSLFYQE